MDIGLKGDQSGVSVAKKIRKQADIPIVYLTAYTDAAILQEAQQTEPYGYVLKPFDPTNLVQVEILGDRVEGFWDKDLMTLMLTNLLNNAVKYSPNRAPISLTIGCPTASEPEFVVFRLQDHGIGIPPEDMPRLFESFHRARNADTIAGVGLGLAIVQQCVDRHQGKITVESEVGRGTIVEVKLPRGEF